METPQHEYPLKRRSSNFQHAYIDCVKSVVDVMKGDDGRWYFYFNTVMMSHSDDYTEAFNKFNDWMLHRFNSVLTNWGGEIKP